MGLDNVAMIMAPNLLLQSGNKIDVDGQQKAEVMTDIMRMLIKYQAILWTVRNRNRFYELLNSISE